MLALCDTQQSSWNGCFSSCIILDMEVYFLTGIIKAKFLDSIPWMAEVLLPIWAKLPKEGVFSL